MAKNPITGLEEEEEINISPVKTDLKGNLSTGFSPLKEIQPVKLPDMPNQSNDLIGLKKGSLINPGIKANEVNVDPLTGQEIDEIKPIDTPPVIKNDNEGTGIDVIDTEIDNLRDEKAKDLKDTTDSFNIAKGKFEEEKGLYKNFDEVNNIFESALGDIRKIQTDQNITDLTDEQLQIIADNNGLTLEQIKNPSSIFNNLELTDAGKDKKGVTDAEDAVDKITTNFERSKENLAFNLEGQRESLNNQLDDVKLQLDRNIKMAEAQGAFSGAFASSGFTQGLRNIKTDGQKVIDRLEKQLDRLDEANETNVKRLTEDYELSTIQAKKDLDNQLQTLKFDSGLQLNGLEETFGIGTKELTNALNTINEEFGTKSMKVFSDYIDNMKNIQTITNNNIIQQDQINTIKDKNANKRFTELIANDGQLLLNTSLKGLESEVINGKLSVRKFKDLQNIQLNSITSTLSENGIISSTDLQTIQSLMKQGKTPTEIVAQMQSMSKFKPTVTDGTPKRLDLGGGRVRIINADGTVEEFQDGEKIEIIPNNLSEIDFTTNTDLINKFPNEASFKNNNPAGIKTTINSKTKGILDDAGITFTIGSKPPLGEGGNYMKFNTVEDGINAQKILLSEAGSDDIRARLEQWVGTDNGPTYASDLMNAAGIEEGTKFSDLGDDQLDTLVAAQMQRESPNFYNELVKSFDTADSEVPELTSKQKIQGDALAVSIYGKRVGAKPENQQKVYDLIGEGMTIDEVEDTIRLGGFGVEFTGDIKSSYDNISVSFSKDKNNRNQAILEDKVKDFGGNSSQVKGYLKRIARESMSSDSEKKIKGYELLERALSDIRNDLKEYENLGGKTNIFAGKTEGLFKRVGSVKDAELRKIATKIAKTMQVYRQSVSGAAFTESESLEYKNIFPSEDNIGTLNTALIDGVLESNTISIDTAYSQQMGYDEYNNIFKPIPKLGSEGVEAGVALGFSGKQGGETDTFNSLY